MGKGRRPCCDKGRVKKGPWSEAEDSRLITFIQRHGHSNWRSLPKLAGLARCGKSCRLRWVNYLRPDVKRGNFAPDEEETILRLHSLLGNKWSKIAAHLPGRTDNEIKNVWNTHLKKRAASEKTNQTETSTKTKASSDESSSYDNGSIIGSSSDTTSHDSNTEVANATQEMPCGGPNYADLWDSLLVESEAAENTYDLWSYGCSKSFELGRIDKGIATTMTNNGEYQGNADQEMNKPYQMEGFGGGLDEELFKMDGNLESCLEIMAWEELPTIYGYLGF